MFTSREFFSEGARQSKIKSPLEMVVSAARALDAQPTDAFALVQKIADMGEPLYAKEAPNGYKDTRDAWLSTAAVMARVEFATALAEWTDSRRAGGHVALRRQGRRRHCPRTARPRSLRADTGGHRTGVCTAGRRSPRLIAGLVMSSPEFQRR